MSDPIDINSRRKSPEPELPVGETLTDADWAVIMAANKAKAERMKKMRESYNDRTKREYKLKGKKQ
jgi:hypothetical protein